jgi:flagellar biosynthesis protein FliQ
LVGFCLIFVISFPWMLKVLIKFTNQLLIVEWDNFLTLVN